MFERQLRKFVRAVRLSAYKNGLLPVVKPGLKSDLLIQHLLYIFEKYKIDAVIDVGANVGQFCGTVKSRVCFNGPVYCFEPDPRLIPRLEALRDKEEGVVISNSALGSKAGTLTLNVAEISTLNSFMKPSETGADVGQRRPASQIEVKVDTLDTFLEGPVKGANRVFLKLDTQGFDLEVLAGLDRHVDRVAAIMIEVAFQEIYQDAPTYRDTFDALREKGFVFSGMPSANVAHDVVIDSDCIFLSRSLVQDLDLGSASSCS